MRSGCWGFVTSKCMQLTRLCPVLAQDQERPTFGQVSGEAGARREGAEADFDDWENVLGQSGTKKRGAARSTKRARMAPVRRKG